MRRRRTGFALVAVSASVGCLALAGLVGPDGVGTGAGPVAAAHGGAHAGGAAHPVGVVEPRLRRYVSPIRAKRRANWLARAGVRTTKEISFSWQTGTPHPIERFESNGLAAFGKLWVLGGFGKYTSQASPRSDVYDPATDGWKRLPDAPKNVTHAPAVLVGDTIWVLGGFEGKHPGPSIKYVLKYDIGDNAWSRGPDLPAQRGAGGAAAVGSKIYFFGGSVRAAGSTSYQDKSDLWVLDTSNQSEGWKSKANFPAPRNHLSGAAINGDVYAFGGQLGGNESQGNQKRVDRYDPETNSWTRVADMPTARGHITASTFAIAGRIIVGGGTNNGNIPSKDMAAYDPSSNRWTVLTGLPSGRKTPVMGAINGKLVSATGYNGTGTRTVWVSTTIPDLDGDPEPPPPPPPPDEEPPPPATGAYLQQDGVVTIEAENHHQAVARSSKAWQTVTPAGAVGSAVAALPDTDALYEPPGALTQAPELRYRIHFTQAGTYRLALRILPRDDDDNSVHVGIDGTIPASSDKIQTTTYGDWIWMDESRDGPAVATINVPTAGEHTIHVVAREDGLVLDRLVIAPAGSARPSGTGPAESPRA